VTGWNPKYGVSYGNSHGTSTTSPTGNPNRLTIYSGPPQVFNWNPSTVSPTGTPRSTLSPTTGGASWQWPPRSLTSTGDRSSQQAWVRLLPIVRDPDWIPTAERLQGIPTDSRYGQSLLELLQVRPPREAHRVPTGTPLHQSHAGGPNRLTLCSQSPTGDSSWNPKYGVPGTPSTWGQPRTNCGRVATPGPSPQLEATTSSPTGTPTGAAYHWSLRPQLDPHFTGSPTGDTSWIPTTGSPAGNSYNACPPTQQAHRFPAEPSATSPCRVNRLTLYIYYRCSSWNPRGTYPPTSASQPLGLNCGQWPPQSPPQH
jgi:hypothetical protein